MEEVYILPKNPQKPLPEELGTHGEVSAPFSQHDKHDNYRHNQIVTSSFQSHGSFSAQGMCSINMKMNLSEESTSQESLWEHVTFFLALAERAAGAGRRTQSSSVGGQDGSLQQSVQSL